MAEYPSIVLTNAGLDMIADSQAGQNLIFTKLKIGDGLLGTGENISTLTGVKSPKLDIPIQGFDNQGNGQVRLRYLVDNSGVSANQGFFAREVGVYAKIGESGAERLYAYTNGGNKVDWIPDLNTPLDAQIFDVFVLIGNASNVTIVINGSATYATVLDLDEHNEDPDAHGNRYLRLAGGTLTGAVNGVTPGQFDNTTKLVTTEFVKKAGLHHSGVTVKSASATLTATDAGSMIIAFNNTGPITITLPLSSTLVPGTTLCFLNASAYPVTIMRQGGDTINPAINTVTSVVLQAGETFNITLLGIVWECFGGSAQVAAAGNIVSSGAGWTKFADGTMIQRFQSSPVPTTPLTTTNYTLPLAFVGSYCCAWMYANGAENVTTGIKPLQIRSKTSTVITLYNSNNVGVDFELIAFGRWKA